MSSLPKPVLRGYIKKTGLKMIVKGLIFASFNASMYYFFCLIPGQKIYEDFVKTYDAEAHYKDLKKWGYFKSLKKLANEKGITL